MEDSASLNKQLAKACKEGKLAGAQELVLKGASLDTPTGGNPPLFNAAYNGHSDIIDWLLKQGARIDALNSTGSTALIGAAEQGKRACAEVLLAAGADPEIKNNYGHTARSYAIKHGHRHVLAALDRNPDEVVFSWRVRDRTLQEVFNFAHRERITFIRNGADGPVEAVTRESFFAIADRDRLKKAFDKYKEQGGELSEDEVFATGLTLKKPRLGK